MSKTNLPPEHSIEIINQAIGNAKQERTEASYYLLLWGILIFIFFAANFTGYKWLPLYQNQIESLSFLVYPIGGVLSFIHSKRVDKTETVKFFNDRLFMFVWGGVGLCLGVWTLVTQSEALNSYISILILMFGFASFITGGVTGFPPSLAGGVVCIICAAISEIASIEMQFLCGAAGMVSAMIIPGLLLHTKRRKQDV